MAYYLLYTLTDEVLVEWSKAEAPAKLKLAHEAGFAAETISGCEARQYVRDGRPHETRLPSPKAPEV